MSDRVSNTAERLTQLMIERGLKQVDIVEACQPFCEKYGVQIRKNDISQYVHGRVVPGQDKLTILALALNVSEVWLMGYDVPQSKGDFSEMLSCVDNIYKIETKKFPLFSAIACGEPIFADDSVESYIEAGSNIKADFCVRAKGDSMIGDRIFDGDIVFIKKQPVVENGQIAAVLVGDSATLKRVVYDRAAGILQLFPSNPAHKIQTYSGDELNQIRILGKAVKCQFDLNQ